MDAVQGLYKAPYLGKYTRDDLSAYYKVLDGGRYQ